MPKIDHLLIVVNPISGNKDKADLISLIQHQLRQQEIAFTQYKTTGSNDEERIADLIKTKEPDRILVIGGDGTINLVSQLILDTPIILGVIPAGSANGLATNFGLSTDRRMQLEVALGNHIIEMDTLLVNDRRSLHIADLGINAQLIKAYDALPLRGKLGYFLASFPTLWKFRHRERFTISMAERELITKAVIVVIANATTFGTGVKVNPKGSITDGEFELIIFEDLSLKQVFNALRGKLDYTSPHLLVLSTTNATISCSADSPLQIDGEYLGSTREVQVKMSAKKVRVAVPKAYAHTL